jgi:hypothetical protein
MGNYRFDNHNLMAIYRSDVYGDINFSVRELANGKWEWTITVAQAGDITIDLDHFSLEFPIKGVENERSVAMNRVSAIWDLDPDFYPVELHDGLSRQSLYWGWRDLKADPILFPPLGPKRLWPDGVRRALVITKGEYWGDIDDAS